MRPTAAHMAASLGLQPHPEGGYYLETYRAAQTVHTPRGERPACTAIVFLVTEDSVSRLHRLLSDELWVFQGGLPLELVTIAPGGELRRRVLGDFEEVVRDRDRGQESVGAFPEGSPGGSSDGPPEGSSEGSSEGSPQRSPEGSPEGSLDRLTQALVPAGSWQGARLAGGPHLPADYAWALVSCVVTPGFDFSDFELGVREALLAEFPRHADVIRELT